MEEQKDSLADGQPDGFYVTVHVTLIIGENWTLWRIQTGSESWI